MENNVTNEHYKKSVNGTLANFANFLHINNESVVEEDVQSLGEKDINYLTKRIAENMFYFTRNINTAKRDFITLLYILMKKGLILSDFKDQEIDREYPYIDDVDED